MNIYDVAREAGVSIATVSRVINGNSSVSPATKSKVEEVLERYDYSPNAIARGLVTKSMHSIGVVAIDIRDIYYAYTAFNIEQELSNIGYNAILCNTGGNTDKKKKYINTLIEKNVDGIILIGSVFKDIALEEFLLSVSEKIPIVMINSHIDGDNIYSIICDVAAGVVECIDELAIKGHKDIIYLQDSNTYSAQEKVRGFREGMQKNKLKLKPHSIITVDGGLEGGYAAGEFLIKSKYKFSAVVTGEDIVAVGLMKKLIEKGVSVPEDVAVTGFNNSVISKCCMPELTTIDAGLERIGAGAVQILSDILEGQEVPQKTLIPSFYVVRQSS